MKLPVLFACCVMLPMLLGGCSTSEETPPPSPKASGDIEQPPAEEALVGRTWRLVAIQSMDDTTYAPAPEDRSRYSLRLNADGSANLRVDCNRAVGPWTSESAGKLRFGMMAATKALCPPDSLHDRYLAQFEWVRSYVMKGGHLFLATMADGSIIEFEPVADD
jgi:para-nitrobenzyl esterase